MQDNNVSERIPKVKVYDGPDDSSSLKRGIEPVNSVLERDDLQIGTVDQLLSKQLQEVLNNSKKSMEIVDIGSGPTAELLKDISRLTEQNLPETVQFLNAHPDFQILCTGLTDAQSQERFFQQTPLNPASLSSKVTAENVEYTLTAKQTFDAFLTRMNIEHIDLAMATFSLTYMGPKVFEQTVRTVIEKLSEGGRFVAAGYSEDHPSLERNVFGGTELKIRNRNVNFPHMLDRKHLDKKLYEKVSTEQKALISHQDLQKMISEIEKAEEYLEKVNILSPDKWAKIKRKASHYWNMLTIVAYYDRKHRRPFSLHSFRHDIANERHINNISRPIWTYQRKLLQAMRVKKQQILVNLSEEFKGEIEVEYSDHVFIIKKKRKTTEGDTALRV